jgi:hypothetical protein
MPVQRGKPAVVEMSAAIHLPVQQIALVARIKILEGIHRKITNFDARGIAAYTIDLLLQWIYE